MNLKLSLVLRVCFQLFFCFWLENKMDLLIFNLKNAPRCIDIDMQNKRCGSRNITVSTDPDTRGTRQDVVVVSPSEALSIFFFLSLPRPGTEFAGISLPLCQVENPNDPAYYSCIRVRTVLGSCIPKQMGDKDDY